MKMIQSITSQSDNKEELINREILLKNCLINYLNGLANNISYKRNHTFLKDITNSHTRSKIAGAGGVLSGLLCTAVSIPLSYEFGEWLAKQVNINDQEVQHAIAVYFGGTSFIPMSILAAKVSASVFSNLTRRKASWEKIIANQECCKIKPLNTIYVMGISVLALLTGTTDAGVTYIKLVSSMGQWCLIFAIPDLISSSLLYQKCCDFLFKPALNNLNKLSCRERSILKKQRGVLIECLEKSLKNIQAMPNNDVALIIEQICASHNAEALNNETLEAIIIKLRPLFQMGTQNFNNNFEQRKTYGQRMFGWFGGICSGAAAYAYWSFGKETARTIYDKAHINQPILKSALEIAIGGSSFISRFALNAHGGAEAFDSFYSLMAKLPLKLKILLHRCIFGANDEQNVQSSTGNTIYTPLLNSRNNVEPEQNSKRAFYLRNGLRTLSLIIALSAAIPTTEMTRESIDEETYYGKIILACSYIGNFAWRFVSLDAFCGWFCSLLNKPTDTQMLAEIVKQTMDLISKMPDEWIYDIYKEITEKDENLTIKLAIQ